MLPTQKTKPVVEVNQLRALIYGAPKIGKSTWCSQIENALFLATEPGLNTLEVYQLPITSWDDMLNASAEILKGEHKFTCIIIDTIDNAFRMCTEYIMKKYKVLHPSDLSYGKGWDLVTGEFRRVITKLAQLPYGLILTSHAQGKKTTTLLYGEREMIVPTVPDKIREFILGFVDAVLYCDYNTELVDAGNGKKVAHGHRVMHAGPHLDYEAGCRFAQIPDTLPLDYKAFLDAFNSKQQPKIDPLTAKKGSATKAITEAKQESKNLAEVL